MFKLNNLMSFFFLLLILYLGASLVWAWLSVRPLADIALQSPYESVSKEQRFHLLQVVDPKFPDHSGINFSPGQGRDTLTSEVADMVFFEGPLLPGWKGQVQGIFRQIKRCCHRWDPSRFIRTLVTNSLVAKDEQLQIYLSNVYMGTYSGKVVYGMPSASLVYFHKHIDDLSDREWLILVAMVLDPDHYHPLDNPVDLDERVRRIERMLAGACVPKSFTDVTLSACDYADPMGVGQQQ